MKTLVSFFLLFGLSVGGQNFAVLKAKDDASAPVGIPTNWPTRIQPIGDAQSLPAPFAAPWQLMTAKQLEDLKATNEAAKEAWNKAQEDAPRIAAEQAKAAEDDAKAAKKAAA